MSGVNAMFAQCSTSMSVGSAGLSGAGGAAPASTASGGEGSLPNVTGALGVQSSILVQSGQQPNMDAVGALALGMLLGKSGGSKDKDDKDDSWKMLAMMAMMGGMGKNQQSFAFSQTTSQVQSSYAATAASASTGSVSVQA